MIFEFVTSLQPLPPAAAKCSNGKYGTIFGMHKNVGREKKMKDHCMNGLDSPVRMCEECKQCLL